MALYLSLLLLIAVTLFLSLCLHKIINRKNKSQTNIACENQRLPPGRKGWPLVGETLDYYSRVREGVPEKFVTDRKNKYSSEVFRTSLLGQPVAILCGAEANKFLFSNEKKLVQVWWPSTLDKIFPKSDKESSSENSRKIRKLLPLVLKADALKEYVSIIDSVMKQHLQTDWENSKQVKAAEIAKKYTFTLACRLFLSIEDSKKINEFKKSIENISKGVHVLPLNLPGTALYRAIEASKVLRKEIEGMIKQRKIDLLEKNSPLKQDIMTHMLLTTDENGQFFNESDIASHLVALLQGGYKTVHSTITLLLKYLAEIPDVYDRVLREQKEIADSKGKEKYLTREDLRKMKYTWNAACEVLRLMPPGIGSFKEAIVDFNYGGYLIPKGWKIHWMLHATHKNPQYFSNPEKFDPSRFEGNGPAPYTFVPFGGGSRMCPGNEYARLAILVFVHNVVMKFRWEKLIPDEKVLHGPVPRPAKGLPIFLYPRNP